MDPSSTPTVEVTSRRRELIQALMSPPTVSLLFQSGDVDEQVSPPPGVKTSSPPKPCCLCYDGHSMTKSGVGVALFVRTTLSQVGLELGEEDLTFCPFCLYQLQGMLGLRREMDRLEQRLASMISGLRTLLAPSLTHESTIGIFEGPLGTSSPLQPCKQEGLEASDDPMDIVIEPSLDFVYKEEPGFDEEKWIPTQDPSSPASNCVDPEVPRKRFDCPVCDLYFTHASHLKNHSVVHTGEKPYSCQLCPQTFSQKGSLHRHITKHSQKCPFICPDCGKAFKNASRLKEHSKTHATLRERKSHACDLCSMTFTKPSYLKKHVRSHVERPFSCDFCEGRFKDKEALDIHVVKWHSASSVLEGTFRVN